MEENFHGGCHLKVEVAIGRAGPTVGRAKTGPGQN